ncbi:hypothetical protein BCR44DRAFT_66012 [Catenaria anguillulae PL171]|uniref:Uncharacterized protein n=1 Tax=Catenaria anguillulae PL171 TaxID=765915 RepID=A0A1Y2H8T6_9FUNG|nr:hypothetical protein BCR44DRAFT_66012 [Catenaria anguillulae PL171]
MKLSRHFAMPTQHPLDSVGLSFELVDPILCVAACLIRPTNPATGRLILPDGDTVQTDNATESETALTSLFLVIHPSPDLCATVLPRMAWLAPNRTLSTGDVRFVDTWARAKPVVLPFAFDIRLDLATWCFVRAARPHVLDWLACIFSLTDFVLDSPSSSFLMLQ